MIELTEKQNTLQQFHTLLELLSTARLDQEFLEFCRVTNAPPDLRCLIPVAANLSRHFASSRFQWSSLPCFGRWPELLKFIVDNRESITMLIGAQVNPQDRQKNSSSWKSRRNPMYGEIKKFPIFAMLCDTHENPQLRDDYAALQMQFLYAHWIELEHAQQVFRGCLKDNLPTSDHLPVPPGLIRDPEPYARAVRDLSGVEFSLMVKYLAPECSPSDFRVHVRKSPDYFGRDFSDQFGRIREYCDKRHGARVVGKRESADRRPPRPTLPDFVYYNEHLIGANDAAITSPNGPLVQRTLYPIRLPINVAIQLGLAPGEITGGQLTVSTFVPDATNRSEAEVQARDHARSFEIDRRLFPWNSEALRAEEIHFDLLPAIEMALEDDSQPAEAVIGATLIAIMIETGRDIEDVLSLQLLQAPQAQFGFQFSATDDGLGYWTWPGVGPDYATVLNIPEGMEAPRADFLRYGASGLVTAVIRKYSERCRIRSGKLFRQDLDYKKSARDWIQQNNARQRYTLTRLANLRWTLLHEATDGDLATSCLVLGVKQESAKVQLHYAVLQIGEAWHLFENTTNRLWGSKHAQPQSASQEIDHFLVGCRAFPDLSLVRRVIAWLREGSQALHAMQPRQIDLRADREILNRAVLYLLWHQFFAFGTRAIRNAYQTIDTFAGKTGVGILSDKDFADGYKTRVILADSRLKKHMSALEQKLSSVAAVRQIDTTRAEAPIWFLDEDLMVVQTSPSEITKVLSDRFPFPVNTPRKIMRNLLREKGMSYEHAEAYMGHWSHGREPWSQVSTFDYDSFLAELRRLVKACLEDLGFDWVPGEAR